LVKIIYGLLKELLVVVVHANCAELLGCLLVERFKVGIDLGPEAL
jgi:hypothetical protein